MVSDLSSRLAETAKTEQEPMELGSHWLGLGPKMFMVNFHSFFWKLY